MQLASKQITREIVRKAAALYKNGQLGRSGFRLIATQALANEITLDFEKKSRSSKAIINKLAREY